VSGAAGVPWNLNSLENIITKMKDLNLGEVHGHSDILCQDPVEPGELLTLDECESLYYTDQRQGSCHIPTAATIQNRTLFCATIQRTGTKRSTEIGHTTTRMSR
jgi:hypothetical protein